MKVIKFGGSSLANATQLRKVFNIVKSDSSRKIVVVSAPGKRSSDDEKVTDLLIQLATSHIEGNYDEEVLKKILVRYKEIRRKDFPEHKFTIAYLAFEGDDYELELTYNYGHGPYEIGDGYGHIAISAKDLEGLHAEHVAKGYDVTDLKGLPGHPANYYFVKDLDGYKIEVIREK